MGFKDYFRKNFETSDNHEYSTLRTHYYIAKKEEAIEAVNNLLAKEKVLSSVVNEARGEIIFEARNCGGTFTITNLSYTNCAIDIQVNTYNILPGLKGIRIIEHYYEELDKMLRQRMPNTR